ncbi:hypothetical protein KBX31_12005 [Liquorilactobacillus satsumensis]|uniref:hypothetical protein n=1 Tax=Liquorilactobacillus satsumensis TaxID=259059 RepID=UPI0021C2FA2E|nr:hypothetical protein [Liquorilactobacillus satsumensis]MCP9313974.1 hypothetical protein [Liquorilactobacillus satsumensis]MCP9361113.1 hypothetical protein [Liquorilactobacillus satsumensis]
MSAKEKRAAELKAEKKRAKQTEKQLVRPLKHSIEERPVGVDKRKVFGHWEVDCVLPKMGYKQVFVTFCERKTRYYIVLNGLKSIFETGFKRHSELRLPSTAQINH